MLVKIVHPGGHVELHDRPVLASEIMLRNPRCCVTHPDIFQQPWAIVSSDTNLLPGQKFYVVPMGTIRKLQKHFLRNFPASRASQQAQTGKTGPTSPGRNQGGESDGKGFNCWLFGKNKRKKVWERDGKCDDDDDDDDNDENCFDCLIGVIKIKDNTKNNNEETRSTSSSVNGVSSETVGLNRRRIGGGFVKRRTSCDNWQPSLQSVIED
ncbi:unnamed protein product [Camellia sinensis]